ncbi:transmembrane protein 160 [Hemiscyllium ocellatum]|uniref:transmembrane protein 160 n=1 Tax=Hemiscyllium ocellatum TaxID=170820 RepID=UPI002966A72B|nr:transmembrane protein 160 [Hemiscyllium ocellatum]
MESSNHPGAQLAVLPPPVGGRSPPGGAPPFLPCSGRRTELQLSLPSRGFVFHSSGAWTPAAAAAAAAAIGWRLSAHSGPCDDTSALTLPAGGSACSAGAATRAGPGLGQEQRARMLRKAHETGFLSWFRNGLLATGVGVISYMQSDTGREAAYGFFILGGVCISYGSGSYIANLFLLRRMMMLSVPTALVSGLVVGAVALFWLCAVSLYIGRLEVEIIHDEECEDCKSKEDKSKSDK